MPCGAAGDHNDLVARGGGIYTVVGVGPWVMANRPAAPLLLREGDRDELDQLVRSTSVRAGVARRARIVLLAVEGSPTLGSPRRWGAPAPR